MQRLSFRLLALASLLSLQAVAQHKQPNIIVIFSDDHAYQAISAYGSKLAVTPNIDRIARSGALFSNALVTNSICGPSRATLLTGKYSHENGFKVNERQIFNPNQEQFQQVLRQQGYQTAWIGKWHLGSLPTGFDYFNILNGQGQYYNPDFINAKDTVRHEGYVTNLITDFSEQWLNQRDTSRPFFLVVGEKATHREWFPDLQDLGAYDDKDFPLPSTFKDDYKDRVAAQNQDMTIDKTMRLREDLKVHVDYDQKKSPYSRFTPEQKEKFKAYYDKVSAEFDRLHLGGDALVKWKYERYLKDYLSTAKSLDRNIGKLLDYLDAHHLRENTVVIYASDQGFYMGEHGWFDKRFIYEQSLKTAFLVRYPGVVKPGTRINQLTANIDWAPTLLDIAHAPIPAGIQGRSFLPLLKGDKTPIHDAVYYHYYEFPQPHHVYPHFGVRTPDYTLVHFYGEANAWELYDLKKDPQQVHNLYKDAAYAKTVTSLKTRLEALIKQYDDKDALEIFEREK
ncbi:sulfatase [Chitinophaga parva]|uniref:Sulfatase n=1 Tax=Chitinophaga parva TaxID=2169414 RepID=A0A2T7BHA8_9BACT|nr:sulfatase [Chitinophaga parva]PUZ25664.1 sulfatase [Chitinophaga parva]